MDLIARVQFYVWQYNCISRETGKETDLRKKVATRIRAVIP